MEELKEDFIEVTEYVASETADVSLLLWLQEMELKFGTIYRRLSNPVRQQSDFDTVKSYVEEGKLPPLGEAKTGIQYINKKGN
jgi:hypothetical protein